MTTTSSRATGSLSYGLAGDAATLLRAKEMRAHYLIGLIKPITGPIVKFAASLRREKARASSEAAFVSIDAHTLSDIGVDKAAVAPLVAASEPETVPEPANDRGLRVA